MTQQNSMTDITSFTIFLAGRNFLATPLHMTPFCGKLKKSRFIPLERLYCKRPILCLASSKILTSHLPHRPASVYTPGRVCTPFPLGAGGGHICWVERGVGVIILEDARHSSVLYICKYFVFIPKLLRGLPT
jgi:hypothetical protein